MPAARRASVQRERRRLIGAPCRWRRSWIWRQISTTSSRPTTVACWNSAPSTNPPYCSASAETEPGDDHARQVAEPGRGHDHEGADRIGNAVERLDHPDHRDHHAGGAADGGVERIGEGIDALGVDAEDARGTRILRRGADRLAHATVLHEQDHDHGEHPRRARRRDQLDLGDRDIMPSKTFRMPKPDSAVCTSGPKARFSPAASRSPGRRSRAAR